MQDSTPSFSSDPIAHPLTYLDAIEMISLAAHMQMTECPDLPCQFEAHFDGNRWVVAGTHDPDCDKHEDAYDSGWVE